MRQVLGAGALGRPRGMGWGGRWEGGSGRGTHIKPWLIHVNVWQKPLQYCKVISLQLIKINGGRKKQTLVHYLLKKLQTGSDLPVSHSRPFFCSSIHLRISYYISVQFSSVAQSCSTPCNPMNRSMPGLPVHCQLPEFTQIHVH